VAPHHHHALQAHAAAVLEAWLEEARGLPSSRQAGQVRVALRPMEEGDPLVEQAS